VNAGGGGELDPSGPFLARIDLILAGIASVS
jgi:hypothetical protein